MYLRRSAAVLAASTVLCTAAAAAVSPVAFAAPAAAGDDDGLYGKGDPKYDGVWRQSVALLAQDTVGVTPGAEGEKWLLGQQCADGSFAAYRADPGEKCGKQTPADINATAAAVQALAALGGHSKAVEKSVSWLESVQNEDGGWGYNPGSPSDANSVSIVIGAFAAVGQDASKTVSEKDNTPFDALAGLQLRCDAKAAERGAFAYQPDKKGALAPNADATAAAALAGLDEGLVVEPLEKDDEESPEPLKCGGNDGGDDKDGGKGGAEEPEDAAEAAAAYLADVLEKNDHHLDSVTPGAEDQPDYGNTADAVIALAAGGHGDEARATLGWLEKHAADWDKSKADPAALGSLVLASRAAGADPRDFGGTDLVKRLNATGPTPRKVATPEETAAATKEGDDDGKDDDDNSTVLTFSLIGAGLAAGAGIGFLLSSRRKRQGL
ncbi:hypothetical protein LHJ74_09815 [Streptomyces sp. N2-109]|uniref:Squalene cyclase C-terminal domain-containing protein n=1 Tax=Streptomyces gossypii TaxID=2883101 RepID=A0ABT2JQP8_9ACTN|nr:prenyltransferase/squalene oxidase repeat-containing protein [Streptomyces gossypii]MCT2590205.1 hypothetical protein [Streptomyces gossypii]